VAVAVDAVIDQPQLFGPAAGLLEVRDAAGIPRRRERRLRRDDDDRDILKILP
jgi:hypothetical protein